MLGTAHAEEDSFIALMYRSHFFCRVSRANESSQEEFQTLAIFIPVLAQKFSQDLRSKMNWVFF